MTFRLYRASTLFSLRTPLRSEISWLNPTALKHLKNYQIWQHRQMIISRLGDPTGEPQFIDQMLKEDAKNYHVWSYRQWLVREFGLYKAGGEKNEAVEWGWNGTKELQWIEKMISEDVRNNSAWNHRWFVVFGCVPEHKNDKAIVQREIE